jgi:hypothetical protein
MAKVSCVVIRKNVINVNQTCICLGSFRSMGTNKTDPLYCFNSQGAKVCANLTTVATIFVDNNVVKFADFKKILDL